MLIILLLIKHMWLRRIASSLLGIKTKTDLEKDLKSISVKKAMLLFVSLNITFIALIFTITSFFK
tara:strand:+ start:521 stop:715 length:195 start_codon:yes stop_codon:yes gene_type:complete